MNIAMFQTMNAKPLQPTTSAKLSTSDSNAFGSVFSAVMSTSNRAAPVEQTETTPVLEEVQAILSTESLEQLLKDLEIPTDEAGLFAFIGEGEEPVAIDEMLNLADLTEALGMTEEQLTAIVAKLVGEEQQEITDVWSMIEQAPAILSEIVAVLQGTQQNATKDVQPDELQKVVQLLKLAELLGSKTDTVYTQEAQLSQLRDSLTSSLTQVQQTVVTVQQEAPKSTFQQIATKIETDAAQPTVIHQQTTTQTKTVTITLPAEKPAQSEALLKEIQNLINRSQLSGQQGNMKLLLKLFPENLGQIRIELIQKDGVLTARLLASTSLGKELLDSNLNQLKAGFVAQNIQMDRIDIAQSLQDANRNASDQSLFSNFFRQQAEEEHEEQDEENDEEKLSFSDLLNEEVQ